MVKTLLELRTTRRTHVEGVSDGIMVMAQGMVILSLTTPVLSCITVTIVDSNRTLTKRVAISIGREERD